MPERAVPCCCCLAALAAWKDGAAPFCRDGNLAVTKKWLSLFVQPSQAILVPVPDAAARPAREKAQKQECSAVAAEKTPAAVGKIAMELQQLRG
ncbi:hypothetical protein DL769_008141 [Monosporascus sp. CRB-8-3]|nr:hypothetical protein DL769_008141 [Monosporascus sp. CRB-8-3]